MIHSHFFFRVQPNESQCSELWLKLLGKRPFVSIELLSYKDINLDLLLASVSKTWEKPAWEIKIGKQSWEMERHGFPTASVWGLYPVVLTGSIIPPNFSVVKLNKFLFLLKPIWVPDFSFCHLQQKYTTNTTKNHCSCFLNSLKDILINAFPLESTFWVLPNTISHIHYSDHKSKNSILVCIFLKA